MSDAPAEKRSVVSDVRSAPNATYAFTRAFFEELARSGVEHVCVSPGSRSTPLAVTAASIDALHAWSIVDERSAGFFALGLAKATRCPVALVCTSGSALANYAPAVVEAHYAGVPLVILSADRPPELREWGAGQTIDQVGFFGSQVRYFAELPLPEAGARMLRYARATACRAVAESIAGVPGPVHLNWPLREPLEPVADSGAGDYAEGDDIAANGRPAGVPYTASVSETVRTSAADIERLAAEFASIERGVIACGMLDEPGFGGAVASLAKKLGWPVLADPISGARCGEGIGTAPVFAGYDLFLRDADFQQRHRPEVVLRFGGTPTCKAFRLWLEAAPPEQWVVVGDATEWSDPSHLAANRVRASATDFCLELNGVLESKGHTGRSGEWLQEFRAAEEAAQRVLDRSLDPAAAAAPPALYEPAVARSLGARLPSDSLLYVSNSMPIRDLDAFMAPRATPLRVLANRGTNGIDGMLSSALGASAAGLGRVVLFTGDLACLYDIGALLTARRYPLNATIVVINNDGGGIFSFLPIAQYGEDARFDELFDTPHGLDFAGAAAFYGMHHERVASLGEFEASLEKSFSRSGVSLVEVAVDGDANRDHFRELVASVQRELAADGVAK
ncbi:MAG: 2-succinyl-5-enolpyruvyl-6-hydroxy-3-cyclohexene-1-carboxylic-acid synthase [Myxococcota bacterium]|jgi:2-succinyl-5-enolpyruvyl-6-hydroxy-3-cyclohexene-1-carboxylate synthase|nr:2-succinyl-5-enolpyruvyl-6-hydroxy-3-cyclohexene-1-carboxylic-acid synthase [Myxococcota bacterium]